MNENLGIDSRTSIGIDADCDEIAIIPSANDPVATIVRPKSEPGTIDLAAIQKRHAKQARSLTSKKIISQGLLDIALLTANALQIKYVMQSRKAKNDELDAESRVLIGILATSIILQIVLAGLLLVIARIAQGCKNDPARFDYVIRYNNLAVMCNLTITVLNILAAVFAPQSFRIPGPPAMIAQGATTNNG